MRIRRVSDAQSSMRLAAVRPATTSAPVTAFVSSPPTTPSATRPKPTAWIERVTGTSAVVTNEPMERALSACQETEHIVRKFLPRSAIVAFLPEAAGLQRVHGRVPAAGGDQGVVAAILDH